MSEPILRKRKIRLNKHISREQIMDAQKEVGTLKGVVSVKTNWQKKLLLLEYDLRNIKFENIEKTLNALGVSLSQKLTERFKRGMAKFTEQNELDSLNAPVSSCCEDPKSGNRSCEKCL